MVPHAVPPEVTPAPLRARVLAGGVLEVGDREVRPSTGTVEALLAQLLLRPNEVLGAAELASALWPDADADADGRDGRRRQRLYVVISRLRAFLAGVGEGHGAAIGGLRLVTGGGGYRLVAGVEDHDRLAFDALAERALAGDRDAAREALALVGTEPYAGLPPSPEREVQRIAVLRMRDRLREVARTGGSTVADRLARARFLRPPGEGTATLARPRLLARVGPAGTVALVVAVAPAGFGKTTFLAQWAETQPGPVAWLELDERDDDPRQLWGDVWAALVEAGVAGPAPDPDGAAPGSIRFREELAAVLAHASVPVALVLDDAHEVRAETWSVELPRLLALAPGRLSVAVGTRRPLDGALGERARTVQLTADDLRLDRDETLAVVRLVDPTAEAGDIVALAQVAAGWPIVVSYLSRSGARPDGPGRSLRPLHEYVVDEVLDHLPPDVRDLLLGTAALDRLDASLCDAVTGRGDARRHLGWLRDQALVLDVRRGGDGWVRRHPLVAQALRERADVGAEPDLGTQHRRAARWFLAQGMPEEALRHAVAGGDAETIAATAGDVVWAAMGRGEVNTCRRWLQLIDPEDLIADRAHHDLLMLVVQRWAEPELAEAWLASRRRHYGAEGDVMALQVETHRHYLEGRLSLSRQVDEQAAALVDDYFARHPNRPGVREIVAGTVAVGPTVDGILAGEVHHDDPRLASMVDQAAPENPLMALWILGEWSFLAWTEGRGALAARLVDRAAPTLRGLDEASAHHGACRLLAAAALVESDRTVDRHQQRRIGDRLAPMVPLFRRLRWDVELVPVLLALHLTSLRAGHLEDAARWSAEADVLLRLCDDVPLLVAARDRVAQAGGAGGGGEREVSLTPREGAVLQHLRTEATYAQIADALGTSHHTVRSQAAAVYRKLGVRNRKGLRARAADARPGAGA